ncbi:trace amine-associated receptor 13c-like [Leuresthes tenuis]|uniref:trace amine-associated receptor 13c-like n=1 Tax=Leuresthes tenuis TaxID=355514 RepID=UPI003B506FA3
MEETELCFPHINSSCRKQKPSYTEAVLSYTLLSFISLLTTSLNLLVIISISHFKQLHTPSNLLLLSLAVSDFFVGLLMSFLIIFTDGCWYLGDQICAVYSFIDSTIITAPVGTMVLISVDRYVAICDPLHYHQKITVRRVSVFNVLCWTCSIIYIAVLLSDVFKQPGRYNSCYGECVIAFDYIEGIIDFILVFVAPVTVIIVLYLRVFVVAVSQARAMRCHIAAVTIKPSKTRLQEGSNTGGLMHVMKSEIKAARTLGIVVITFLTCYSPYFCSSFLGQNFLFGSTSVTIEIWLFYFNSCLNPLIYAFFYPWFRRSVKLIVTLKIFQHGSSGANIL